MLTEFGQGDERGVDSQRELDGKLGRHYRRQDESTLQEELVFVPAQVFGPWRKEKKEGTAGKLRYASVKKRPNQAKQKTKTKQKPQTTEVCINTFLLFFFFFFAACQ